MSRPTESPDTYYIPPNFIDTGTVMGGMFKLRNVIEAGVLAGTIILPLFRSTLGMKAKIIVACVTALPIGILALVGIDGESLSSFIINWFKFLTSRRVIGKDGVSKSKAKPKKQKAKFKDEFDDDDFGDFSDEFDEPRKKPKKKVKQKSEKEEEIHSLSPVAEYLPIKQIKNGIIYTRDHRYVKIIEVSPINFLLRSDREQRNIIYSFVSYLKISPIKLQFKVLTKKADVNRHLDTIEREIEQETDERCRVLQEDYAHLIRQIGSREAITRRFFIIFEYEGIEGTRRGSEDNAINSRIYKNANMAILGTSGSGKTFTRQLMALRMRRKNIQTFIIAPLKGNEFYRACNNIGGEFIQISPASPNCINIMEIRKTDTTVADLLDAPAIDKSLLAAKIQKLHIFFSLLIPDMNYEEKQLLDDALIRTYANKGITHNNESLVDPNNPNRYKEMPILGDLHEVLKASPETKRLANIVNRFVGGSARSFNQQTNVRLDNKYIVLDISELTGDLLTVGMFIALDYVWDKAKEGKRSRTNG